MDEHVAIAEELNKKGHLAEALQVLEKGLKIDPKSARMRSELARVHLVQKNYEQGRRATSRRRSSRRPTTAAVAAARRGLPRARRGSGRRESIFKRLLERDPDAEDARVQMGRVYLPRARDEAYDEFLPVSTS